MIGSRKVIGICMTKINDITRSDLINRFYNMAKKAGHKVIVFNSFVDFYNNDSFDRGASTVYDLINHDMIDVLVVMYDQFVNKSIADKIIADAKVHNTPVVVINHAVEGCASVTVDYRDCFKTILRHVIKDHKVTDTLFIAGKRDNDTDSAIRVQCYREVMTECGLPVEESRIDYGEWWDTPTLDALNKFLRNHGGKPPRAIFCANDFMAFAIINHLRHLGYSVPDDVIVTGFDGVPEAKYFTPSLTTCNQDVEGLALMSVTATVEALKGNPVQLNYVYNPVFSESCGCASYQNNDFREVAGELYNTVRSMEAHEDYEYSWIDRILDISDMNSLYNTLSGCMLGDSYACLNSDFAAVMMDPNKEKSEKPFTDQMLVVGAKYSVAKEGIPDMFSRTEIVPNKDKWGEDDSCYILSSIYVGDEVVGYYAVKTGDVVYSKRKMKRVLKTINISFNVAMNYFRQKSMTKRAETAALTNHITNLPNLRGTKNWFEEFGKNEENYKMALSFSVYNLPKYTYIFENFGIEEAETALRFVAQTLGIANPEDCFIGHITEDTFLIINYYKDPNSIADVINKATSFFFNTMNTYNSNNGKPFYTEVNCGCTVSDGHWTNSLESYISIANTELYMNRLNSGKEDIIKESRNPKDYYKAFSLLTEKNLFSYHFQPIVSARSGEIYAYEALMRTHPSVGMNPLEVLEAAKQYHKLYEIERATLFNIMERFVSEIEAFGNKTIFINTIPGHFLNDEDTALLSEKYGQYSDRFIFELTEQDTVSDEELSLIRSFFGSNDINHLAIDDYGAGHSNIVNLMRYSPHVIKIDRYLITDIHKDMNKQMFVRNTIEFARLNNIKVLAEGVETSNEMRTVIDLGVDLIQGYYTGRPSPDPVPSIADDIRMEIIDANPRYGKHD